MRRRFDLRRAKPTKTPRKRFWVYCEEKNTEPLYLHSLKHKVRDALIEVEVIPAAGAPKTIAESASAKAKDLGLIGRRRKAANSFESNDEVWAAFDRDTHPNYNQAISICENAGISVAYSDPCFELWLILHIEEFDKPVDHVAIQKHLEKISPGYSRKSGKIPDCAAMISNIGVAEDRASKQIARRDAQGSANGRPSTTFYLLTRAIQEAADNFRLSR